MIKPLCLLAVFLSSFQGMTTDEKTYFAEQEAKAKQVFLEYLDIVNKVKTSDVFIYEGLPHNRLEHEVYKSEKQRKHLIKIGNFLFYDIKNGLKDEEAKEILSILLNPENFKPYIGPKLCGGFHPDYDIKIITQVGYYHFQVCFGCHEIKIINHNKEHMIDMISETVDKLESRLIKYHKHRPERYYFKTQP